MTFQAILTMPTHIALTVLLPLVILPTAFAQLLLKGGRVPEADADGWTALNHVRRLKWLGLFFLMALPFAYALGNDLAGKWGLWSAIAPALLCLPTLMLCLRGFMPTGAPSAAFGREGIRLGRLRGTPQIIPWQEVKSVQDNKFLGLILKTGLGPLVLDKRWPGIPGLVSALQTRRVSGADRVDLPKHRR
ncbi:hypothetical protein [Kordiimonas marina]|uniref:hypothetical protein n=1 Tax=Kordiimonas marina TaxID=2872312 RepID=UPI001FF5139B|nr:hypothetical protein [Kordiimonas marina]MCJ9430129.1 hypothetical protein [Kordiimonas marina]